MPIESKGVATSFSFLDLEFSTLSFDEVMADVDMLIDDNIYRYVEEQTCTAGAEHY